MLNTTQMSKDFQMASCGRPRSSLGINIFSLDIQSVRLASFHGSDAEHCVFPKFAIKREKKKSGFFVTVFLFCFCFLTISITRNTISMLNSETDILRAVSHCNLGLSIISTMVQAKTET